MDEHTVAIIGLGSHGQAIFRLLSQRENTLIKLADHRRGLLSLPDQNFIEIQQIDLYDADSIGNFVVGSDVVISAASAEHTPKLAATARRADAAFFDINTDIEAANFVDHLAKVSERPMFSRCGISPLVTSAVARQFASLFDKIIDISIAVGMLPLYPSGLLQDSRSPKNLVDCYTRSCEIIHAGNRHVVPPMSNLRSISIDGASYESFLISDQLGGLLDEFDQKINSLSFNTITHRNHHAAMSSILNELGLNDQPEQLAELLENVPRALEDVVIIHITATGWREIDGRRVTESYVRKFYGHAPYTAEQNVTAHAVATLVDLYLIEKNTDERRPLLYRPLSDLCRSRFAALFA